MKETNSEESPYKSKNATLGENTERSNQGGKKKEQTGKHANCN